MFLFFSILAASIDRFISGIIAAGSGVKMDLKNCIKVFFIIFVCCMIAALPASRINLYHLESYTGGLGILLMIYLAYKCLNDSEKDAGAFTRLPVIAFYTALDAAVVCVYLSVEKYNIFLISFLSALLHSLFMAAGIKLARIVIKNKREMYTRYISAGIFIFMAVYKAAEFIN